MQGDFLSLRKIHPRVRRRMVKKPKYILVAHKYPDFRLPLNELMYENVPMVILTCASGIPIFVLSSKSRSTSTINTTVNIDDTIFIFTASIFTSRL